MADWLKNIVEEVNRQFDELPEWKKVGEQQMSKSSERELETAIREPKSD